MESISSARYLTFDATMVALSGFVRLLALMCMITHISGVSSLRSPPACCTRLIMM